MRREQYPSEDPILDEKLTYYEFIDMLSGAWVESKMPEPTREFRLDVLQRLDDKMRARSNEQNHD